jgi:hypothetical protein
MHLDDVVKEAPASGERFPSLRVTLSFSNLKSGGIFIISPETSILYYSTRLPNDCGRARTIMARSWGGGGAGSLALNLKDRFISSFLSGLESFCSSPSVCVCVCVFICPMLGLYFIVVRLISFFLSSYLCYISSSLTFPKDFPQLAGFDTKYQIKDANAIKNQYVAGNTTAAGTVDMLDYLVQNVYKSTPDPQSTPYACEFNGLAALTCENNRRSPLKSGDPIRAVGLAGLLVPAPWATGGQELSLDQAAAFYTTDDFDDMKDLGLNSVQIEVPTVAFQQDSEYGHQIQQTLQDVLNKVWHSGLKAIMVLIPTGDEPADVLAAALFAHSHPHSVLGLTLPKGMTTSIGDMISSIRMHAPTLNLFLPTMATDVGTLQAPDEYVFGALELPHTDSVADIASSDSTEDRSKMFYHEATSCMLRSPLEYLTCVQDIPTYVASGFDLAIDNCIDKDAPDFKDYGQCDRFEETMDSGWWETHRQSFAARQVFAYERGLGWSFATWKLYDQKEPSSSSDTMVIDKPVQLLAFKYVVMAGLFPNLLLRSDPNNNNNNMPAQLACLNPPTNDYILGDDTLSPTPMPPPDCGQGWWNATTSKCDYWIPPPPTDLPTTAPTEGCPVCDEQGCNGTAGPMVITPTTVKGPETKQLVEAGIAGAVVAGVLVAAVMKYFSGRRASQGYSTIPN